MENMMVQLCTLGIEYQGDDVLYCGQTTLAGKI